MTIIDLDDLSCEHNEELNKIAVEIREDYNNLVESVSAEYTENLNWIVGSVASRNKYYSPLFMRCCRVAFIQKLIVQSKVIDKVKLADRQLANVIRDLFITNGCQTKVICTERALNRVWRLFRPYRQYLFALFIFIIRLIGRSKNGTSKRVGDTPITLVDTFVLNNGSADEGSINNGHYKDRYYPGLMDHLTDDEKKNIFYLPTIVGFNNPLKAFKLIREANAPFLIHDDFLNISDYYFALKQPFKLLAIKISPALFRNIDMSSLLKEEMVNHCSDFISILGLLYYRFAYRLNIKGIKVRLLVEWYENQVIDRGMIVGFHQFHKKTKVIGYQGYVISKNLHLYVYPNESEYRSKAVPDIVYVVGEGLKDDLHEFCQDVVSKVGPAFRFNKLWRERAYNPDPKFFTVLIGLPIGLDDSTHILKLLSSTLKKFKGTNYQFWIKPHPTSGPESIKALLPGEWPKEFIFQKGDFHDVVERANLLVSNASSVSLEALAKGVPTIIAAPQNGVVQNPIPETVSNDAWSIVHNSSELVNEIMRFENFISVNRDYFDQLGLDIRKKYFNPVSRENTIQFLEL
jgi:hypothetical protein